MSQLSIELKGRRIGKKQVPIDILGRVLLELNNLIRDISSATERLPKKLRERKEFFKMRQLYVTGITGGSTIIEMETEAQTTLPGISKPALLPLQKALEGFEIIQSADEKQAYKQIQDTYPDNTDRVHILNDYKGIWRIPDHGGIRRTPEVEIAITSTDPTLKKRVEVKPVYYKRIDTWLTMELKAISATYRGIITRIKADGENRYFTLIDEKNKVIECELKTDKESAIIGLFKVPVELKGIISQVGTKQKIKKISGINKLESITITPEDFAPLTEPIELNVEYDITLEQWIGEREDLGLRAVGDSLNEVKSEILILLNFMIDVYLVQQPKKENLSPELQKAIEELKKVINISKVTKNEHWKFE